MKRLAYLASALALLAVVSLAMNPVSAQGDKTPSVKEIMKKLNGGPNCVRAYIDKDLKADNPDWDEIQKNTKEYATLAAVVGKNDPPKGDKASWAKLTKTFADNAKALDDAARNKNKNGAVAAHNKLVNECTNCHKVHRPDQ